MKKEYKVESVPTNKDAPFINDFINQKTDGGWKIENMTVEPVGQSPRIYLLYSRPCRETKSNRFI